ncbi:MAG: diguanylate cyclase response regulator, partial [Halorhodospira sp.]
MADEGDAPDRILVVEDSRSVAGLIAGRIEDELALTALIAGSRAEAQRLLEAYAGQISAAILDLDLPDAPQGEVVDDVVAA